MTNTERFYKAALNFQNDRAATVTAYERKMQELEKHKGSEFYDEESKKAADAQKFKLDSAYYQVKALLKTGNLC